MKRFSETTAGLAPDESGIANGGNLREWTERPLVVWKVLFRTGDKGGEYAILHISSPQSNQPTRSVTTSVGRIMDALKRMDPAEDFPFLCQIHESSRTDAGGRPYLNMGDVPPEHSTSGGK